MLARLAAAPQRCLRLSALASAAGLSLSRVSRIAAALEARGLISREPCSEDARAVEARLTAAGLELMRAAQQTHFASVQRPFFDQLGDGELETLAGVFGRMAPAGAPPPAPSRPAHRRPDAPAEVTTRDPSTRPDSQALSVRRSPEAEVVAGAGLRGHHARRRRRGSRPAARTCCGEENGSFSPDAISTSMPSRAGSASGS